MLRSSQIVVSGALVASLAGGLAICFADGGDAGVARYAQNTVHFDAKTARLATPPARTSYVCSLIGLAEVGAVSFNFPGADDVSLEPYRNQSPLITEAALPAGAHKDVARVFAADMGWPFEHSDGFIYFTFDDAFFPPPLGLSECPSGAASCTPTTVNDDFFARADPNSWSDSGCIGLEIERAPGSSEFLPITVGGPVSEGGTPSGRGVVPGPGFSTGRFMFLLMPLAATTCSLDADDCAAVSGISGDRCLVQPPSATGLCHFGPCGSASDSACALRLPPSTLVVRAEGSNVVPARVGEHIVSNAVLAAYRGHFATVTFQARIDPQTGSGVVWVLGRDSFWSTSELSMNPYLMFHPVTDGMLGEPQYFSGSDPSGQPTYSTDPAAAVPLYAELPNLPQHSSLMFMPELDQGTWVLIYGGHAQVSLRNALSTFIRPVSDSLFFDRDAGIYLRWAKQPWGPWSSPVTIWNPYSRGQGGLCEQMYFEDPEGKTNFRCPTSLVEHNATLNRMPNTGLAGEYGAAIVPRSLRVAADGGSASFRWLLSTWNPYRVILLETRLSLPLDDAR